MSRYAAASRVCVTRKSCVYGIYRRNEGKDDEEKETHDRFHQATR